jgi:hypothetical protein
MHKNSLDLQSNNETLIDGQRSDTRDRILSVVTGATKLAGTAVGFGTRALIAGTMSATQGFVRGLTGISKHSNAA